MALDPDSLPDEPKPKLSFLRVFLVLLVFAAIGGGAYAAVTEDVVLKDTTPTKTRATWFAPYVDTTLTPTYAFQSPEANPAKDVALGFVVADKKDKCEPSWGTYFTLNQAATKLNLDRRVAQVRGAGGDAIPSFGGAQNTELAIACKSVDDLKDAYNSVIKRYAADTLDFDIEGTAVADSKANERRAKAVSALQSAAAKEKNHLAVWLTLPVTPQGLQADALETVRTTLEEGVNLAGVNIMAMDYGEGLVKKPDMLKSAKSAAEATHRQLAPIFSSAGVKLNSDQLWNKLGVTVMIGQNDIEDERLSTRQARKFQEYARHQHLGRVSIWSLNRDSQCGPTFAVVGEHSNFCSGVKQKLLEFSTTFAELGGNARAAAKMPTSDDATPIATTGKADNPKTSPYPVWNPRRGYRQGTKVVWHQAVYQANYFTQGQTPDKPPNGEEPWLLLGPVLQGDEPAK